MVKTAVILAAGFGSRLKERTKIKPKGFLEIENISLIQRSINNLLVNGIENIYIGTGYLSEVYESFSKDKPYITCIKSDKYETTSSMYTLYNMRDVLKDDFLLLESDLLYEKEAIKHLQDDLCEDVILASGKTYSGDEVFIQTDELAYLIAMSKDKRELDGIYGELTGISKVSYRRYQSMCDIYSLCDDVKIDYEYVMVESAKVEPFYVKKIEDLLWCEIDDEKHLERALKKVLPKIKEKDERS
jgi:2-aminoethylphosphonate-pyruvate transaminase